MGKGVVDGHVENTLGSFRGAGAGATAEYRRGWLQEHRPTALAESIYRAVPARNRPSIAAARRL